MNWRTLLAVDHDPDAVACYRANVPAERVVCAEVSPDLLDGLSPDVLLGGPPCQPYSTAGKREGGDDDRDGLPVFLACVEASRPRQVLMENVPGLLGTPELLAFVEELEALGYAVSWRELDAANYGVPQHRRRVWVWGIRDDALDSDRPREWPAPTHAHPDRCAGLFGTLEPWVTCGEALGLAPGGGGRIDGASGWSGQRVLDAGRPAFAVTGEGTNPDLVRIGTKRERSEARLDQPACTVATDGRDELRLKSHADAPVGIDRPAPTLRSGGAGHDGCRLELYRWSESMREKHPPAQPAQPAPTVLAKWAKGGAEGLIAPDGVRVRRLTPDECARLQSVPDAWVWPEVERKGGKLVPMPKTAKYRIVGNGWACRMAHAMSLALRAADPGAETVASLFCGGGLGDAGWHGWFWEPAGKAVAP